MSWIGSAGRRRRRAGWMTPPLAGRAEAADSAGRDSAAGRSVTASAAHISREAVWMFTPRRHGRCWAPVIETSETPPEHQRQKQQRRRRRRRWRPPADRRRRSGGSPLVTGRQFRVVSRGAETTEAARCCAAAPAPRETCRRHEPSGLPTRRDPALPARPPQVGQPRRTGCRPAGGGGREEGGALPDR